jgi:lipoyl(octanoyl) transferase
MLIKDLGRQAYLPIFEQMREFTVNRQADTEDQIWLLEHESVFTQGQNGSEQHLLNTHDIAVVQTDRGGQVTYHGPGQLVAYTLIDLKRHKMGIRQMVSCIENSVIVVLKQFDIVANARKDAPGVYVEDKKIASLGLRVKKGRCYHGVSLNVDMDLTPFSYINPCGYQGMQVMNLKQLAPHVTMTQVKQLLVSAIEQQMQQGESHDR